MTENEESKIETCSTEDNDDPYAYLKRGEFSSEGFKVEVKKLPKYYGINEFKKLMVKLKLNHNKIKTPRRNNPYLFVCFRNEEDREHAITVLNQFVWKGSQLVAIKAKPSADPLVKKRKLDAEQTDAKKTKLDDCTPEEKLKMSATPLWNMDYNDQLKMKHDQVKNILKNLSDELNHKSPEVRKWLKKQNEKYDGLPCDLLDIRHAEQIDGYRNKCEFTVGINEDSKLPTVGFRFGSYVSGVTNVGPVDGLRHIADNVKTAVKVFQEFVRNSKLEVFNPEFQTGHFKQLSVRTAPNQLMLIVGICPQGLNETEISEFKQSLIEFFSEGDGKIVQVTSLYYEAMFKKVKSNNDNKNVPSTVHLWGDTHIYDSIRGLKFRISPEAFYQINSGGTEILYNTAIELAEPTQKSTVLDVCCGTGTIGLCFAKECNQVLGLEIVPQAIEDAKVNAVNNNVENCEFFVGKAEEILGSVCYKSVNDDVIAIVDPPRAGLHQKAIAQLRKCSKINRIIYISCNPKLASKNFVDLGRPESKMLRGEPFVPVKAVAVDMFPHTNHCELVVCFKRFDKVEQEASNSNQSNGNIKEEAILSENSENVEDKVKQESSNSNNVGEIVDAKDTNISDIN